MLLDKLACTGLIMTLYASHHLFGHMDGSGVRGRSQKQWVDYVREDLQFAELSTTWWRQSQDRAGWRAAIECLLQRT